MPAENTLRTGENPRTGSTNLPGANLGNGYAVGAQPRGQDARVTNLPGANLGNGCAVGAKPRGQDARVTPVRSATN